MLCFTMIIFHFSPRFDIIRLIFHYSPRFDDEQVLRRKSEDNLLSTEQALSHKEKLLLAAFREHDEVKWYFGRQ